MAEALSRLAGPANVGSGTNTAATVPGGHTWTSRSIRVANDSSGPITFKLGIGGVVDADLIIPAVVIGAGTVVHDDAMFVFAAGETIQTNASATGLTLTICGLDQS